MGLRAALEVALEAAQAAGAILRDDLHRPGGPRGHIDKADADVEAENAIRARLLAAFPGWGYLGEETGAVPPPTGAPVWLVDPNDGTSDYLKGRRGSAVSIGLATGGRPVLGVVFAFAYPDDSGDLFAWAEGGGGVTRNGRAVEARLPESLTPEHVVLVSSSGESALEANLAFVAPARCRTLPSIAHRLAAVAAGEGAATTSVFAPCSWDFGAGHALVRGAGGRLVGSDGRELVYAPDGTSHTPTAFAGSPAVVGNLAGRGWVGKESKRRILAGFPARLRRGETVREAGLLARAQGCLLGQVAGDSLGSLVEFQKAAAIARHHPDGPRRLADGGTFDTLAGQPTDDSELALALARSVVERGAYSEDAALSAYRGWLASAPFDVGNTVRAALSSRPNPESQANGSLMRASPLGIFAHAREAGEVAALASRDSDLTHPHPVCRDATAAFVVAVAHAIRHGDGPEPAYRAAVAWARSAGAQPSVVEALDQAATGPPAECDGASQGWVLIALRNAFHELLLATSLEEGVVRTVRRGGDTDTNAAIAGALLGAVHGRDAVPAQWRQMVLSCRPLAGQPGVHRPRPEVYWPVDVMELAERLLVAGRG